MARKKFEELTIRIRFNPNEVDEDTIVAEIEDCLELGFGRDVAFVKHEGDSSYTGHDEYEQENESEAEKEKDEDYE